MASAKELAALSMTPTGDQFFDRIIGFRLYQNAESDVKDLVFTCPKTGPKPAMTLHFKMLPNEYVSQITLTISNMYLNLDLCSYKYLSVTAGYSGRGKKPGLTRTFKGEIINAYNESPNPNGAFVIQCVLGEFSAISDTTASISYTSEEMGTTLRETAMAMEQKLQSVSPNLSVDISDLPKEWLQTNIFPDSTFSDFSVSALDFIDKIRYRIQRTANATGLEPVNVMLEDNIVRFFTLSAMPSADKLKAVTAIGTAYIEGDRGVVTAPWNPSIHVGDMVYIPRVFFRSRIRMDYFNSKQSMQTDNWKVYSINVLFASGSKTNQMTLELINMRNGVSAQTLSLKR